MHPTYSTTLVTFNNKVASFNSLVSEIKTAIKFFPPREICKDDEEGDDEDWDNWGHEWPVGTETDKGNAKFAAKSV